MTGDDENIGPEADAAMTALYRKLDDQLPEGEPNYDVTEGLGKVLNRINALGRRTRESQESTGAAEGFSDRPEHAPGTFPPRVVPTRRAPVSCSCGCLFAEGDAFCGNCGRPRPLPAPPPSPFAHHDEGAPTTRSPESAGPSPFDADDIYLKQTLRHEPGELALDNSVSLRKLVISLVRAWLAGSIVFIVPGILGSLQAANGGGGALLSLGFFVSIVVFWVVLLVSKVTEPVGEWRTLLADRAGQSESYYRTINAVLQRRELPIATTRLRSIQLNAKGRPVKHMIELSENEYQIYVTLFPYGTSLYVGWQMWRRRSGAQLVKRALADLVKGAAPVTVMLRTDRARALREAVHLACREVLYATVDEGLRAEARQMPLPQVEQETALLQPPQPASPSLPQLSGRMRRPTNKPLR